MSDIFQEVEEEYRRDKWADRWRKYGWIVYLVGIAIIAGVALNEWLQDRSASRTAERAAAYESAIDAGEQNEYEAAASQFEALIADDADVAPLAAHQLAGLRLDAFGDPEAASEALARVADLGGPAEQLALIKAAYLRSDTLSRAELDEFLRGLEDDNSAFGALALELLAVKAIEEGDVEFARTAFSDLLFLADVPSNAEERAKLALAALPPRMTEIDPAEDTASDSPEETEE